MRIQKKTLILLIGMFVYWPHPAAAQWMKSSQSFPRGDTLPRRLTDPPDWLSAGMMEWGPGGQLQASARVIRLLFGEPGRWQLPVSLYSGVSQPGSGLSANTGLRSNETITWQLYSPWSGIMNVGFEGQRLCSEWGPHTAFRFLFQLGERMLSGYRVGSPNDPLTGKQQLLWNHYAVLGWVLHTGAWERSNPRNMGRGWVMLRGHLNYSSPGQLRFLFPLTNFRGVYGGVSLGLGIEVSRVVHVRAGISWPVWGPEWSIQKSWSQFSFQYNWKP